MVVAATNQTGCGFSCGSLCVRIITSFLELQNHTGVEYSPEI